MSEIGPIVPTSSSVQEVLTGSFLEIPAFQRPYAWRREQVEDLWLDLIDDANPGYFIGPMVFYRVSKDTQGIVDGQQRLTTLLMLLSLLRDSFRDSGRSDLSSGIQRILIRTDIANRERIALRSESSHPFLRALIFDEPSEESAPPVAQTGEHRAIASARADLQKLLWDYLGWRDGNPRRPTQSVSRLEKVRDRALNATVLSVRLTNDLDAFTVFETLNSRGLDLGVSDLLKNHFLSRLPRTYGVEVFQHQWAGLMGGFEAVTESIRPDLFIFHWWQSLHGYTTQKRLFREAKRDITGTTAKRNLQAILADGDRYRRLASPGDFRWGRGGKPLKQGLEALLTFGVEQPRPMLLALLRAREEKVITAKNFKAAVKTIEDFHFTYTAIGARSSSSRESKLYANLAFAVHQAKTNQEAMAAVEKLRRGLARVWPGRAEFMEAFRQLYFTNSRPKDRALVKYILRRLLEHHLDGGESLDFDEFNIEHLRPQGRAVSVDADDPVGRIGNLVLVPSKLNSHLGNRSFPQKKASLIGRADVWVDDTLKGASRWDERAIVARTDTLAELAFDRVWAAPSR